VKTTERKNEEAGNFKLLRELHDPAGKKDEEAQPV
jgi:hypothetical protein